MSMRGLEVVMFDKFVRVCALLLAALFLYVYWLQGRNGRYQFSVAGAIPAVVDTRTGDLRMFSPEGKKWVSVPTGADKQVKP
jgi:hypothetical protein